MNKTFTIDLWKKCLGNMYGKVPVRKFFSYIDIIHVFIDDKSIFLFAPNSHVKVIVDRYYYNQIINNIKKFVGNNYNIEFKVGIIYIDDARKIFINATSFISLKFSEFKKEIKLIYELHKCKNFFIHVHIERYLSVYQINKLILGFNKNGINGIKTNLHFLLTNEKKINNIVREYDMIFLIEKKYDCNFYLLLNKNIDKIKNFIENNNIIFISKLDLDILKEKFLKIK